MKKIIVITGLATFTFLNSFSQCISCFENSVSESAYSSAIGRWDTATGHYSIAAGYKNIASGINAITMGGFNIASGDYSLTLGGNLTATATKSIVIGYGYNDQTDRLVNSHTYSLMVGFSSKYPTLFVGTSYAYNKTGKIGIGNVTDPQTKLHLRSDTDEPASLFLEPSNWTTELNAELFLGNLSHGISAEKDIGLVFKTEKFYLFNQGNIGIGTEQPAAKVHIKSGDIYIEDIDRGIIMKSPDGTCWRGTLNDQGQLIFQALSQCPQDAAISIKESTPNKLTISIHPNPAKNIIQLEIPDLGSKSIVFKLVDENGKVLKSINITGIKTTVNIADLAPGLYFGNFIGDQVYFVEKIIKL
jgi:hypothetical protein